MWISFFLAGAIPATGANLLLAAQAQAPNPKPAISRPSQPPFDSPCIFVLSCLVFCSTNQTTLFNLSPRLYTGELLIFAHQRHPLSLLSDRFVLRYCHTTTALVLETIIPTPFVSPLPARLQPSRTDRPTDCFRLADRVVCGTYSLARAPRNHSPSHPQHLP